jgi:putative ABC transport system permease protein
MLETVVQDLRLGTRMLVKNPGFALVAILSIAIGVGANAAMFSVADGLVLRPLPVPDPRALITVSATTPAGQVRNALSYPDYLDLRDRTRSFEGLFATRGLVSSFVRRREDVAQSKFGLAVSANFFDVLHVRPALGRTFVPDEDRIASRPAVLVLSYDTWTEQFGADPTIVGREVRLTGEAMTVIGVTPEDFTGIDIYVPPAFYVPIPMVPVLDPLIEQNVLQRREIRSFRVMGRLKAGASLTQAGDDTALLVRALQQQYPATNQGHGVIVRRELDARFAEYSPLVGLGVILIGLAIAVLLVACANVAGLLTSRAPVRAREIAIRLAIGGSRARLIRQLITESTLIAIAGGIAGMALGYGGIRSFQQFQIASDVGARLLYRLDGRAIIVGLVVAAVSALLSSVIPAWRSTRSLNLSGTLRNTTAPASRAGRLWGRHGLVSTQIALTLVLLTVAMSFYRAFQAEYGVGPGFRTDHVLLTNLDPALAKYDQNRSDAFYRLLKERVAAIPRVSSVGLTSHVPLNQDFQDRATMVPEGYVLPAGVDDLTVAAARIDEDYFGAIGIPILSGRAFHTTDTLDSPRVAIVSRGMAARYWPGQNPVGKRIRLTGLTTQVGAGATSASAEIVGVAGDIKFRLFTSASTPFLYLPRSQSPNSRSTLVVRTEGESAEIAAQVRTAVQETGREVPILSTRTIEAFYASNVKNLNRVVVRTIAGMGLMGLALALIGLYGLTVYAVSRRTREIGIRMAIGALPGSVLRMIFRQASLPSLGGIVAGVFASVGVGSLIETVFPGTATDVITLLLIVPLVVAVVLFASYVPARRAAHIDPLVALRHD